MEHSEPSFSDREQSSLLRAIQEVCITLERTEALTELWSWDFLDESEKAKWKERIETFYKPPKEDTAEYAETIPNMKAKTEARD